MDAILLSVTDAAKALGVTRTALSALLNEQFNLSLEMALRIEKTFDVSMDTPMRMQISYVIAPVWKWGEGVAKNDEGGRLEVNQLSLVRRYRKLKIAGEVTVLGVCMNTTDAFDEAAAIGNQLTDIIYPADFKNGLGKFFNIIMDNNGDQSIEYSPPYPSRNKTKITVTFIRANGNSKAEIKEVCIKQFKQFMTKGVSRWEEQHFGPGDSLKFTHLSFEKLAGFLKLLTELDLANLNQRRSALRETTGGHIDAETQAKMKELLKQPDGLDLVDEILRNGSITSKDLVNIGYRKNQLSVFKRLLDIDDIGFYRELHDIASTQHEKILQHFFKENAWIFGFGLDYLYLGILQDEAHVSTEDIAGRDGVVGDFLMGASNFTVLVELKLPDTKLFGTQRHRSGSWKLSPELLDSVSQILEQKAGWQIKSDSRQGQFNRQGHAINQRTVDPKCILIIGSDSQFSGSEKERVIKLKTFELFRRDSRNIEILTYDELFQRANFLVNQESARKDSVDDTVTDAVPF